MSYMSEFISFDQPHGEVLPTYLDYTGERDAHSLQLISAPKEEDIIATFKHHANEDPDTLARKVKEAIDYFAEQQTLAGLTIGVDHNFGISEPVPENMDFIKEIISFPFYTDRQIVRSELETIFPDKENRRQVQLNLAAYVLAHVNNYDNPLVVRISNHHDDDPSCLCVIDRIVESESSQLDSELRQFL